MSETYAAHIVDGKVVQVIVGTSQWASERLGGIWVDTDTLVGIGWSWDDESGFVPPVNSIEE